MFKDMKGGSFGSEFSEACIFQTQSGNDVLTKPKYSDYVDALEKIINIPKPHYQSLYIPLLKNYIDFVQSLQVSGDIDKTLLLDRSLRRAFGFIKYCAPKVMSNNGFGFNVDRLMYALFSAALLTGVGRALQDRQIIICNRKGVYQKTHFPVLGGISGAYYKVRAIKSLPESYVSLLHLIYAQVITPGVGLAWIMEDSTLFTWWAAALADMKSGFSELEIDLDIDKHAKGVGEDLDFEHDVVVHEPIETLEGERFLAWLKEQLSKDSSLINKDGSGLHHVEGSLLVELDKWIEKYISSERVGNISADKVKSQFMQTGVASESRLCSKSQGSSFLGRLSKSEFEAVAIEHEKGVFEVGALGPVTQVSQGGQMTSSEQLFSRVGGAAQQFSIGQTPQKN